MGRPIPPLPLFGGTGITSGFAFFPVPDLRIWPPYPPPTIGAGFGFEISGLSGIRIVVEASTNLAAPSWVALQSFTLTNNGAYFIDPQWTNYSSRFALRHGSPEQTVEPIYLYAYPLGNPSMSALSLAALGKGRLRPTHL